MKARHKLLRGITLNLITVIFLTSCNGFGISDLWTVKCTDMPPEKEVRKVRQEYAYFFDELQEEGLIWSANVVRKTHCPGRAYIIIYHGREWQKPLMLEMMDDLGARSKGSKFFFEVPFRFMKTSDYPAKYHELEGKRGVWSRIFDMS